MAAGFFATVLVVNIGIRISVSPRDGIANNLVVLNRELIALGGGVQLDDGGNVFALNYSGSSRDVWGKFSDYPNLKGLSLANCDVIDADLEHYEVSQKKPRCSS